MQNSTVGQVAARQNLAVNFDGKDPHAGGRLQGIYQQHGWARSSWIGDQLTGAGKHRVLRDGRPRCRRKQNEDKQ